MYELKYDLVIINETLNVTLNIYLDFIKIIMC